MSISRRSMLRAAAGCAAASLLPRAIGAESVAERPNIIFILADDLGYADIGCFGQKKIRTPNIDRLAAGGMRFTQHYAGNAVCAPSRCVLMTGLHPGHAFVRDNREVKPEGQEPIPSNTVTLAKLLKQRGYATGGFGKWGLGGPGTSGDPLRQGFDHFFGYNCQRHAHNYYPTYLWDDDRRIELDNPPFAIPQRLPAGADPNDPASYRGYLGKQYAPDLINERARRFVRENKNRPFFLYMPTTVPHLSLQVPEDSLAEYKDAFNDPPYPGGNGYLPHRTPRAAYAAMISRMDREIGRMLALLEELKLDGRTLVVFTSDNGPTYQRLGGSDSDFFGSAAGFRGLKGSLYEGGVRVPMVARYPGHIAAGATSDRMTGFEDWMPTVLEIAGLPDATAKTIDGISFAPTLLGKTQAERPFLYREFPGYGGQQSVRVGNWKAVRQKLGGAKAASKPGPFELYDLAMDPFESKDVAGKNAQVVDQLKRIMVAQHAPSKEFPFAALDR